MGLVLEITPLSGLAGHPCVYSTCTPTGSASTVETGVLMLEESKAQPMLLQG